MTKYRAVRTEVDGIVFDSKKSYVGPRFTPNYHADCSLVDIKRRANLLISQARRSHRPNLKYFHFCESCKPVSAAWFRTGHESITRQGVTRIVLDRAAVEMVGPHTSSIVAMVANKKPGRYYSSMQRERNAMGIVVLPVNTDVPVAILSKCAGPQPAILSLAHSAPESINPGAVAVSKKTFWRTKLYILRTAGAALAFKENSAEQAIKRHIWHGESIHVL